MRADVSLISHCLFALRRVGGGNLLGRQSERTPRINFPGHSISLTKYGSGGIYQLHKLPLVNYSSFSPSGKKTTSNKVNQMC